MPVTKQTIAIIGACSNFGRAMANGLWDKNCRLLLVDKNREEASRLSKQIGKAVDNADIDVLDCQHLASWEADVIVIAAGPDTREEVVRGIRDVSVQKVVAVWLEKEPPRAISHIETLLPNSKIAGLWPAGTDRSGAPKIRITSGNPEAAETIRELIHSAGYIPVTVS